MCSQGRAISSIDVCNAPADDGLGGFFDCARKRGRDAPATAAGTAALHGRQSFE
jgi:hypothetical protein